MTPQPTSRTDRSAPQLYLVSPALDAGGAGAELLRAAVAAAPCAAVLLRLADTDARARINCVKTIAPVLQQAGVAVILGGHADLVAKSGADGAHLTGAAAFEASVASLKPKFIAGAGGLLTRHDAMLVAERGADYVMFGEPDSAGRRPPFAAVVERVSWWAELFETPCVGYAGAADEVSPLVQAGAEFIALGDFVFADRDRTGSILAVIARDIAGRERTT